MSSDISGTSIAIVNGTVVALQGNAVKPQSLGSNQDGYALTWDNGNNDWEAKPLPAVGLQSQYFISSGTWVCPANVFNAIIVAAGGGGSGGGGNAVAGAGGGGGSLQQTGYVAVIPGNSYSITVGAGGASVAQNTNGNDGSPTSFDILFFTNGGGKGFVSNTGGLGGNNFAGATTGATSPAPGIGGSYNGFTGISFGNLSGNGQYSGGATGTEITYGGGGGGGAGPQGNGASGGNGASSGFGSVGVSATANTGAGGGAGGSGPSGGGSSGAGGSGYLYVTWVG